MQTSEWNFSSRARTRRDWLVGAALGLVTCLVYFATLAPSVAYLFDDSLEFQLLASRMAIAHPTGYPLYSMLIKLATFLPAGDVAYRVNLVSALCAAGTVLFVYLAARLITARFLQPNNVWGEILSHVPAVAAALTLAFGETFWSQAVLAEVYALQALLTAVLLWMALRWAEKQRERDETSRTMPPPNADAARSTSRFAAYGRFHVSLYSIAFFAGLMLTHHRMSVLLYPALAVYVLTYDRTFLKQPLTLFKMALLFLLPLLVYAYLPIRGMVTSSLDGSYQNTPAGFLNWVLGTAYTVFLSQNPLHQSRTAAYYVDLLANDFGVPGVLLAIGGTVALFLRAWREWLFLTTALIANLAFVLTYRVADIDVFFIPGFVIVALFITAGLAGLLWLAYYALSGRMALAAASAGALVMLLAPVALLRAHYARVDLSNKRDVITYGQEVLSEPLPDNATIIGILGEMTLLRYLQETQNIRPDVETLAADKEEDRTAAVTNALKRGRSVYLTRPLKGIEAQNSLSSLGALIHVQPKTDPQAAPTPQQMVNADFGDVKLLGYDRATGEGIAGELTLYWQAQKKIGQARLVSVKLIDTTGKLAGQLDRQPVLDAYPTNAWRSGEYISDAYNVPVFVGAPPGDYALQVTMYDPVSGKVYGQAELGRVVVTAQTQPVARELLGVSEKVVRDLGGVELSGYDLDVSEPYAAGENVPLTLLWRVRQGGSALEYDVSLSDEFGKIVASQTSSVGGEIGQYVRQDLELSLPANLTRGKYAVRATVHGGLPAPFEANVFALGTLEVSAK